MSLWSRCQSVDDRYDFQQILQHLELTQVQKQIIQSRYIAVVEHVRKRVRMFARMFYTGHTTITVGSLFVPALLSIQNSNYTTAPNAFSSQIYWATFIISLLVTICNGMLALFKIYGANGSILRTFAKWCYSYPSESVRIFHASSRKNQNETSGRRIL